METTIGLYHIVRVQGYIRVILIAKGKSQHPNLSNAGRHRDPLEKRLGFWVLALGL